VNGLERKRYIYRGVVQGVGFRPAVFRAASSLSLAGFVQNRRSEVLVEVEGADEAVEAFPAALTRHLPKAARIDDTQEAALPPTGEHGFVIAESAPSAYRFPPIPPDLALCPDCTRELLDPADRRHLYPFITCTQCGPRYSIVESTPFDRGRTSMSAYIQCPACRAEYENPADRRFHSQTNSCPACGPRLACISSTGAPAAGDPLEAAVSGLNRGLVVAVQGIGGFHLAADPSHRGAMERLRAAKERERKPFALMTAGLAEAEALCFLSDTEKALLASPESPILIAARRPGAPRHLDAVSDTETLGVMLPYTPLHLLLFHHPRAVLAARHLVMTSGNRAGEPVVTDPEEAMRRLGEVADLFLVHDRRIVFRTDDSIVRCGAASPPFLLRRSRGHVPGLITLRHPGAGTILGVGGDLKSAPALARGPDVHLSPHLGDLDDAECFSRFQDHVRGLLGLYGATVDLLVHDLHPGYRSTAWAERQPWRRAAVQHHWAHVLSVMAEHGLDQAIGIAFDGTGYGTDGTIWGGEFLHATRSGFRRLGSFRPFPLPGGDAAVLHPPRIAFALLSRAAGEPRAAGAAQKLPGLTAGERNLVSAMVERNVNVPLSSSVGRLFDAAAAALGLVQTTSYEGEGPIRLEGLGLRAAAQGANARAAARAPGLLPVTERPGQEPRFLFDPVPLMLHMTEGGADAEPGLQALVFHHCMAGACLEGARRMREETGLARLALSGGVFQNLLLRELLLPRLKDDGFEVFLNMKVPPGDGGISIGQVYHVPE
jgi:hydrogenase maturation protein HypF